MEGEKLDDALVLGFERALWAMLSDERLLRAASADTLGVCRGGEGRVNDTAGSAGAGVQMIVYTREARAYGYNPYRVNSSPVWIDRGGECFWDVLDGSVSLFDLRMGERLRCVCR